MADRTSIEWTDATWNPVTGCSRTSPGCDNCYALTLAARLKRMGSSRYQVDGDPKTSGPGFGVQLHHDLLERPRRWRKPRTIFVNSMSDMFHDKVPTDFITRALDVMRETPQHRYQILTKRSKRLSELGAHIDWPSNVWMGVSIENDRYTFRADHLRAIDPAVRFLSLEPLLGPVPSLNLSGIDWVIVGGESGISHRPMDPSWVRAIRDNCQAAGVPFFFKQWGGRTPKAGGRTLDGSVFDEMPASNNPTGDPQ